MLYAISASFVFQRFTRTLVGNNWVILGMVVGLLDSQLDSVLDPFFRPRRSDRKNQGAVYSLTWKVFQAAMGIKPGNVIRRTSYLRITVFHVRSAISDIRHHSPDNSFFDLAEKYLWHVLRRTKVPSKKLDTTERIAKAARPRASCARSSAMVLKRTT